jgi:serine protease Do
VMISKLYHCASSECEKVHANVASGVILREDGIILTNYHVVDGKQAKGLGMGVMTADGKAFLVDEVLAADKDADVAILRLKNAKGLAAAPLVGEEPVGNAVTIISHPAGNYFALSQGCIARYRKDEDGACTMQVTADYAKGSSGGPIFNDCGDVVGLVSSTVSIAYQQLPVVVNPQSKSLEVAGKGKSPSLVNGKPLVMDMNHQMTFKNAVASREVLELIE